ncbi:MAG: class I SAM-dependent methyltransferase [Candidatus Omnitrophica bacterium]|nr:class I SAM-dependent methyltransferase [Candidatus Omnitrophota bacterium]
MKKEESADFDQKAALWDTDPFRAGLARDISQSICREVVLNDHMDVADFGCGTGLVALHLRPLVRSVTGFDSSRGMLDVFIRKIEQRKISGVTAHYVDFGKGGRLTGRYHLIVSSMTLHHVKDVPALFQTFYKNLLPGGCICLADLDVEDGIFHDSNEGIHHFGFDRDVLGGILRDAGYEDVRAVKATDVVKVCRDGVERKFSIFLMIAHKARISEE